MTVTEAVRQRRSIRAFLPTPVSEATLREVLDTARWAPSGSNVQAWKIIAVAGDERDAVVRMALAARFAPVGEVAAAGGSAAGAPPGLTAKKAPRPM